METELTIALIGLIGSLVVAGFSLFGVIYSSGKTADKVAVQVQNELKTHQAVTDEKIKETIYENHIAKTLVEAGYALYYYQSEGKAEVSFVIQTRNGKILPIELVDKNLSKSKSLTLFMNKTGIKEAIRVTDENFSMKKGVKYIPIYALFCLNEGI